MKIIKTTTKTYEIYDCAKWEMSVGETIVRREKVGMKTRGYDKCFACGYKFQADDFPYLGLIRNHSNEFICTDCARRVKIMNIFQTNNNKSNH